MHPLNNYATLTGLGLIEFLIVVCLVGILGTFAIPSFTEITQRYETIAQRHQLATLIQTARHAAITLNTTVTLCPGNSGACAPRNHWHQGALAFTDQNNNRRLDSNEHVVASIGRLTGDIRWRSFRNRSFLQFRSTGLTAWQNGHFLFCPSTFNPSHARQLVLNAAGRLYFSRDSNDDGVHEDAHGRPLTCA